jgi:LmeA-like phospholipid-binding
MTYEEGIEQLNWQAQPPPPVRRRKWPLRLAIVLLVLAGMFVAADRIAVGIAESQIAKRVQTSQDLATKPSVTIANFPFLTQLAGMKLDKVSMDARGVVRNGIRVTDLHVDLKGVSPSDGFKQADVDHLTGTAFFSWADMQAAAATQGLDVTLSEGPDNTVRVTGQVPTLGKVTLQSKLDLGPDNRLKITASKVETSVPGVSGTIPRELDFPIALGQLPMDLTLQLNDLRTSADVLRVSAKADHVTITGSGVSS